MSTETLLLPAATLERALQDDEVALVDDAGRFFVERARTDPCDLAASVLRGDVDEAREPNRFAETLAPGRGPGTGGTEPAEAAVVTVVGGECAVSTVAQGDVHTRGLMAERAFELERPSAAELGCDGIEQGALVGAGPANL